MELTMKWMEGSDTKMGLAIFIIILLLGKIPSLYQEKVFVEEKTWPNFQKIGFIY